MKKYFKIAIFLSLFICNNFSQAQIVLDTSDLPKINEIQVTTIVDSSMAVSLSPGNAGANINWDFSALNYCCVDFQYTRWTDPHFSVNANFFPEAEIALKTQCYFYHNWITHQITEICDYRDYFIIDSTGLNFYGADFPNPHKTSAYRNIFPMLLYAQKKINNSRIVIQLSLDSVFVRTVIDTMKADAWGSIITSFGTYNNVIRIYTRESVLDSLYINGVGQKVKYMPNNYYYKWYTKGLGFPVFQINKGILETSPDYQIARVARYKWLETSVSEIASSDFNASLFPNPSKDETILSFDLAKKSTIRITISNSIGQQFAAYTKDFSAGKHQLSLSELLKIGLPKGFYILSLSNGKDQKTLKLIKN